MSIILQDLTPHKREKIETAMRELGSPSNRPEITSANRTTVRSWLNGLGFPTSTYESASLDALAKAYHSFTPEGLGLGLIPFVQLIDNGADFITLADNISEAINRANLAIQNLEYPGVLKPDTQNIEQHIKENSMVTVPTTATLPIWENEFGQEKQEKKEKKTKAIPSEIPGVNTDALKAIASLMEAISKPQTMELDEAKVIALIRKHAQATEVKITTPEGSRTIPTGLHHKVLPDVIKMAASGVNVMMVGPAGSGKTTIAHQVADSLERPFFFNGALSSEYKLSGFVDAQGRIVSTAFRKAYEQGGLYLFDEIDASMPDALLAFNAALANGHADFPDGALKRHENFVCIAAANTYGRGADRMYVGRNQLDGASLDRFCVVNVDYDDKLERTLAANDAWTDYVLKIRAAIFDLKIRHIVSPRASINGARLLAQGMDRLMVEEATIWKGLDSDSKNKVRAKAGV